MKVVSRLMEASSSCRDDRGGEPAGPAERSTRGRVLVVEEHELMATGMQLALSQRGYHVETSAGPTAADVVAQAKRLQPECVLLDVRVGHRVGSGIELIEPLRATGAEVVMLTAERRRLVLAECLEAGAAGWITKCSALDEVDSTIERLLDGGAILGQTIRLGMLHDLREERARAHHARAVFSQLTERETLVLAALTDGLSADEIARDHVVALTTVRSQIRAVLNKLQVRSQLAAVAVASDYRELLPHRGQEEPERRRSHPRNRGREHDVAASIA